MAQLQYIGARYVPVWYHNSVDDSANWEINVEYEPMTFVTTQNNHLYLSKKTVPDNIGTPAQNTAYWLDMGLITAPSQEIQDQINALFTNQGDLNDLFTTNKTSLVNAINEIVGGGGTHAKKYIFVGDSYNTSSAFSFDVWGDILPTLLGITSDDYINVPDNAGGFVTSGTLGTFWEALDATVTTDRDKYTDIIVQGCSNDRTQSYATIVSAIQTFITNCKSAFPNATIHIAAVGWHKDPQHFANYRTAIKAYRECALYGAKYIENAEYIVHDYTHFYDNGHPDAVGQRRIAQNFAKYILDGHFDVEYTMEVTPTLRAGQSAADATYIQKYYEHIFNDKATLCVASDHIGGNILCSVLIAFSESPIASVAGFSGAVYAAETEADGLIRPEADGVEFPIKASMSAILRDSSNVDHICNLSYVGASTGLSLRITPYTTLSGVKAYIIMPHSVDFYTLAC